MKKATVDITEDQFSVLARIVLRYKDIIWNIEDETERLKEEDSIKEVLVFLEKVGNKLNGKRKFGKAEFKAGLIAEGADEKDVEDWCAVRKVFTERAFKGFLNECKTNNFPVADAVRIAADKGWKGFEVKWVTNLNHGREQQLNATATNKPYHFDIGRASETLLSQGSGGLSTDTKR